MSKAAKKEAPALRLSYREILISNRLTRVLAAHGYKMPWSVANCIIGNIGLQTVRTELNGIRLLDSDMPMPRAKAMYEELIGSGVLDLSHEEREQLVLTLTLGEENG